VALAAAVATCHYDPALPNNTIVCTGQAPCPAGFSCVPGPAGMVCCRGPECGAAGTGGTGGTGMTGGTGGAHDAGATAAPDGPGALDAAGAAGAGGASGGAGGMVAGGAGGMASGGAGGAATGGAGGAVAPDARPADATADVSVAPDAPAGADAAPEPSLCPGSYPLCDGFEGPGIQDALWGLPFVDPESLQGSLLTIDPSMHRRGKSSMRVHVAAGRKGVASMHTPVGAFKDFYARIFVFMHAAPRGGGFLAIDDPEAVEIDWDQSGVDLGDLPEELLQRPLPPRPLMPKDRWVCLLMIIKTTAAAATCSSSSTTIATRPSPCRSRASR
jgi:hypothetical protein